MAGIKFPTGTVSFLISGAMSIQLWDPQPSIQQLMTTFKMSFSFVMITVIIIKNYNIMPIIYCEPTFSQVQYCTFGDKKLGGH